MDSLVNNKPVKIVVDGWRLYTVELPQVLKYNPFAACRNTDSACIILVFRVNEALRGTNENALLGYNAVAGMLRGHDYLLVGHFVLVQQYDPAGFPGRAVAGKEQRDEVIGGKID